MKALISCEFKIKNFVIETHPYRKRSMYYIKLENVSLI